MIEELFRIAETVLELDGVASVEVDATSARLMIELSADWIEPRLRSLINEAVGSYSEFGEPLGVDESEREVGIPVLEIEVRDLEGLHKVAEERGDEVTGLFKSERGIVAKVTLRSASVEKVTEDLIRSLAGKDVIVEFAGSELETKGFFVLTPSAGVSGTPEVSSVRISMPTRLRAYVRVCLPPGR